MIRVLIADDQTLVRDGLRAIIELEGDLQVVGEAASGLDAVRLSQTLRPDVVLMDIRMPGLDGIEATRRLVSQPDPPRVLMLTTFDRDEYVYRALQAGASGFLLKDLRRDQLIRAVRTASVGDALIAPAITRRLVERFCSRPAPGSGVPPELASLTPRELEVLKLVARGCSNGEIADELTLGETTVKTHVARIMAKLNARDRVQAVVTAYETGFVQPGAAKP